MPPEQVETAAPEAPLGREAILAQLDAEPEPVAAVVADEADEEVESVEKAEDDETEVEASDEDDDTDEDKPAEDPKTQKGLDAVRRAEKRHREQMTADRAEFASEKAKHAERVQKLDEYESAAKRVKYDPIALLKKLDVSEDDYELIAHAIFSESKAGAADPARKAAAAVRLREREKEDKYTALERKQVDLEKQIAADKAERIQAAEAERYISEVNGAAKAKFPLVAHMMTHSPEDVGDGLSAAFDRLKAKHDRDPKPAEVVAEYDRKERTRLKAIGVDPETVIKSKPIANGTKVVTKAKPIVVPANTNKTLTREEILASIPD